MRLPIAVFSGFLVLTSLLTSVAASGQADKLSPFIPLTPLQRSQDQNKELCVNTFGMLSEADVENMVTTILKKGVGTENRFIILPCDKTPNCSATVNDKGQPVILYNPNFLSKVKTLNFTTATISGTTIQDWQALTILAHELGHHLNYHLTARLPDATNHSMELEADKTAGAILYRLGATLDQAQSVMYRNDIPFQATMTHPSRDSRLAAIKAGYMEAKGSVNPEPQPNPVNPQPSPVNPKPPCWQKTTPGYLGLSGFTGLGGGIALLGLQKWNAANRWYTDVYSVNPASVTTTEFSKYKADYSTSSKILMGAGSALIIGGALIFVNKIARVQINNRKCRDNQLSKSSPVKLFIEPKIGHSMENNPDLGISLWFMPVVR